MTATGVGSEGRVLHWQGMRTWYRVFDPPGGSQDDRRAPVVVCHGGPGITHDYLTPLAGLAGQGRRCVLYDQVGCGRSEHRPGADPGFWSVELFLSELAELLTAIGCRRGYHLVGHSWGGMLALEHATRRPPGLRSIVVADAFASSASYLRDVRRLLAGLPAAERDAIDRHEAAGTRDSPEYQRAMRVFYGRHVCRRRPVPDELLRTLSALDEDATVYQAMAGPNEFTMTGALRTWDITDRLDRIEVPVLLASGRHDQVTPACVAELHAGLPTAEWVIFEDSSHMPHLEEPEHFLATVGGFLSRMD